MSKPDDDAPSRRARGPFPRAVELDKVEGDYYRGRAEMHRRLASQASPIASSIHEKLAEAYLAAAAASECGEKVEFSGDHCVVRPDEQQ